MNKTGIFTDAEIAEIAKIFSDLQKSDSEMSAKIKDIASAHYINERPGNSDFTSECWIIAVLTKLNSMGYKIKKNGEN